ncbi:MAG: MogA/MoaB family molybdenum cofactor biosynthesis protein [Candidatus Omnitrophota bacterium]
MRSERSVRSPERVDGFKVAVLTISDRCSRGEQKDQSGLLIKEIMETINGEVIRYDIIPDEKDLIKEKLIDYTDNVKAEVVLTTGGTGLGPRDVTPDATGEIAHKIIPGISELIRAEGLKKTQNAVLSRAISVVRGSSMIINLPGSPKGVRESLEAILDIIPHALAMLKGAGHP